MNKQYDAVIVGGGAAGLMAAVVLARTAPGIQIALLEKNDRVGKKLLTTGNGRCNLSNAGPLEGRYHGGKAFAAEVFRRFGREETLTLFREIGIPVVELEDQKLFPMSLQAGSVVDQLRFMAEQLGVQLCCCCEVRGILCREDFSIKTSMGEISARQVLVACGGRAAAATGSDGSGYALLENFGHHLTRTYPAIVQLTTDTAKIKPLTGIKTNAAVTAQAGGRTRIESGEVLFTEYGLSGPPVLQVSRLISEKGRGKIILDLLPSLAEAEIKEEISRRAKAFQGRECGSLLVGILHRRLGETVIKCAGIPLSKPCGGLSDSQVAAIAREAKAFTLTATGTKPWNMAQVTAGGIDVLGFSPATMESRMYDRLYAAGEILDVDGDCGGFNLQWAWSSGAVAAKAMAAAYQGEKQNA